MKSRSGSGNGKLILFGEHAAVYGYPAVGTPLPCRTVLEWRESPSGSITQTNAVPLTPDEPGKDRNTFLALLKRAAAAYPNRVPQGGIWRKTGNVPRIGGFGSSAALCVALSRVILCASGTGYNEKAHDMANFLEGYFHGTPSGIDTGMACDSYPAAWPKSSSGNAVRRPISLPPWHLIYAALPRTGSTAESVGRLSQLYKAGDTMVRGALEALGDISESCINWQTSGRIPSPENSAPAPYAPYTSDEPRSADSAHGAAGFPRFAAELANRAQALLEKLSLSTPAMNQVFNEARELGAPGAKLSGGGMGGAFFICAESLAHRNSLLETLSERLKFRGIQLSLPLQALDIHGGQA